MSPNARQRRSSCFEVNVQRVVPQKVYGDCLDKAGNRDLVSGSECSKEGPYIHDGFGSLVRRRHFSTPRRMFAVASGHDDTC